MNLKFQQYTEEPQVAFVMNMLKDVKILKQEAEIKLEESEAKINQSVKDVEDKVAQILYTISSIRK